MSLTFALALWFRQKNYSSDCATTALNPYLNSRNLSPFNDRICSAPRIKYATVAPFNLHEIYSDQFELKFHSPYLGHFSIERSPSAAGPFKLLFRLRTCTAEKIFFISSLMKKQIITCDFIGIDHSSYRLYLDQCSVPDFITLRGELLKITECLELLKFHKLFLKELV
jgi:hypothetical protein